MTTIPQLVDRLIELNGGNVAAAAKMVGSSTASLSRYRSGESHPRSAMEGRLRALVENESQNDLFEVPAPAAPDERTSQLEELVSRTLNALREEFHRTGTVSRRQEVLELVAILFFAHVASIDAGGKGIGTYLIAGGDAVEELNAYVIKTLKRHLPQVNGHGIATEKFFVPLSSGDERFAVAVLEIFERDASAFKTLHQVGRDDIINEVFSRFMSGSFVDEKEMGQYLTPPEIVRFMVQVGFLALPKAVRDAFLDAEKCLDAGLILDPSCGVGSFLAESVRFLHEQARQVGQVDEWENRFVSNCIVGLDKSERMLRLASCNLGLFGAQTASLHLVNSLARSGYEGETTSALEGKAQLILTNPPFGATYGDSDIAQFAMGQNRTRVDSELLFLERYVDWAAEGGVIVSVVPDSVLVNRGTFAHLRNFLRERCVVEAVFSLPPVTFAAGGTSTKTSVLVLRKLKNAATQKTFFGVAKEIGYDVVTRSSQRRRVRHARSDLPSLLEEFSISDRNASGWKALPIDAERWDAAFYEDTGAGVDGLSDAMLVADVSALIDDRKDPKGRYERTFPYIEISDVDGRTGLVGHKILAIEDAPSRARKLVQSGDVLVSTVRPERGSIGVVPPHLDGAICSTGFAVLRPHGIHPGALAWLLKSDAVRKQMVRHNIGIAYPAIAEVTCLSLVLPVTKERLSRLSSAARELDLAQAEFEKARVNMMELVGSPDDFSGEVPDLVEAGEPRPVAKRA